MRHVEVSPVQLVTQGGPSIALDFDLDADLSQLLLNDQRHRPPLWDYRCVHDLEGEPATWIACLGQELSRLVQILLVLEDAVVMANQPYRNWPPHLGGGSAPQIIDDPLIVDRIGDSLSHPDII